MNARTRALLTGAMALVALAGVVNGVRLPVASAGTTAVMDGMPDQASLDRASTDPAGGMGGSAGWGDMAGGVAARPYVTALSVTNDGVTTPVITDGTTSTTFEDGGVAVAIAPVNLCRTGEAPSSGRCYSTPNRVAITVGYRAGDVLGFNFDDPSVPVTPTVNAGTTIDMTIALNSLGQSLRWSGVQGDLLYWRPTNLGRPDATVRVRFRPTVAPWVTQFPSNNGCTATPIFNCSIERADAEVLTATVLLSLDDTLDSVLTGAVFATQGAITGFLQPGGTPRAPALDLQVSSTHLKSDGTPQLGTLKAFIPAATLQNLYGLLPADAGVFTATRAGDRGTNAAPTSTPWTAEEHGADGVLVTVEDITFSVPTYKVASTLRSITTAARSRRGTTVVSATAPRCKAKARCYATVYDLGSRGRARFTAARTAVVTNRLVVRPRVSLTVPAAKLAKGHRYLIVVRSASTRKLVGSGLGSVR